MKIGWRERTGVFCWVPNGFAGVMTIGGAACLLYVFGTLGYGVVDTASRHPGIAIAVAVVLTVIIAAYNILNRVVFWILFVAGFLVFAWISGAIMLGTIGLWIPWLLNLH